MKRFLAILLVLTCLLSCAHARGRVKLPESLVAVEEEAFMNATALDRVVVPEGTLQIGPRAFAGSSLREIVLPESLAVIAEDAFDGCDDLTLQVLRGSYAHQWCALRDFNYEIIEDEDAQAVLNAVHALEWADGVIRAAVTTGEACILRTDVLNESNAALFSMDMPLEAGLNNAWVDVQPAMAMPECFILRAVLVDAAGTALCDARTNSRHTAAHAEFEKQTAADFQSERLMDFGDSGFAVLSSNVKLLDQETSLQDGVYLLRPGTRVNKGDVVRLKVDGEYRLVKAGRVELRSDGFWAIAPDENIYLAEMYDVLKLDADFTSAVQPLGLDESVNLFDLTHSLQVGVAEISSHTWVNVHAKASYNKSLWGEGYFDLQLTAEVNGDIGISLGGEIDTYKNDTAPAIQVFNSVVIIPGVHAPGFLNVSIPLNIKAKAGGTIAFGFSNSYGFAFNTRDGFSTVDAQNSHAEAKIDGEFEISCGPEVSLTVALLDFVNAKLGGGFGPSASGVLQTPTIGGSTAREDSIHACDLCVDMDVNLYARMRATVKYSILEKLSGVLVDATIADYEKKMFDAYFSVVNEEASIYGGEPTFGRGECENKKYRVEVTTSDSAGKAVSGIPLTISGAKTETLAAASPAAAYLYSGNYSAAADFQSGQVRKDFSVQGAKQNVNLQEKLAGIYGVVSDKATGKGISGAAVTLTLPDGSSRTTATDASGSYRFDDLLGGVYSLAFSRKDYKDSQVSDITCPAGEDTVVNASLVSNLMPDEAVMRYLVDFFGEDLIQRMKDAQITLAGSFEYYVPKGMPAETEEGAFLMMELRLSTPLNFTYPVDQVNYEVMREAQCALLDANVFGLTPEEIAACKAEAYAPRYASSTVLVQNEQVEQHMIQSPNYQAVIILRHHYLNWNEANPVNQLLQDKDEAWNSYIVWEELRRRTYAE